DDNSSVLAAMLETARLLDKPMPDIDYGNDFVSYCLEEPPFFRSEEMGSFIHAKSVHEHNQDIIGMISFEMIGYFAGNPDEPPSSNPPSVIVSGIRKYEDRKSTRLNSSHVSISYAVFCLKKKTNIVYTYLFY